ncbi:unnamed protein product, partial [Nesidiocoris tenuis]
MLLPLVLKEFRPGRVLPMAPAAFLRYCRIAATFFRQIAGMRRLHGRRSLSKECKDSSNSLITRQTNPSYRPSRQTDSL